MARDNNPVASPAEVAKVKRALKARSAKALKCLNAGDSKGFAKWSAEANVCYSWLAAYAPGY